MLLCLVPRLIAGATSVFVSQASVMKYLGARANKVLAYGVAAVSGSVLAVCRYALLPLFAASTRWAGSGSATRGFSTRSRNQRPGIILTPASSRGTGNRPAQIGAVLFSL